MPFSKRARRVVCAAAMAAYCLAAGPPGRAAPVIFRAPASSVSEGGSIPVGLAKPVTTNAVTVQLALSGTASNGSDFTAAGAWRVGNPGTASRRGGQFGYSCAALGNKLLVGYRGADQVNLFNQSGELLAKAADPAWLTLDEFGSSVAALGSNRFVVGAAGDDTGAPGAGRAYLLEWNGSNVVLLAVVTNDTPAADDGFGGSVAGVGPDRFVVGATGDDLSGTNAGAAYLYQWNGASVDLLATVSNPASVSASSFGIAVAGLGSNRFLVGTRNNATAGSVHLFEWTGSSAALVTTLTNPISAGLTSFGNYLAPLGGDRFAVGTRAKSAALGGVFLYAWSAGAPVLQGMITNIRSDAISGWGSNRLLMAEGTGSGKAHLYDWNGAVATRLTSVTNPAAGTSGEFGTSVAILASNRIAVGARSNPFGGNLYLYDWNGLGATLLASLTNDAPVMGSSFGTAVSAVGSDAFLVGAPDDEADTNSLGRAYVYRWSDVGAELLYTVTNPSPSDTTRFGAALAAVESNVLVISSLGRSGSPDRACVFQWNGSNAVLAQTLAAGSNNLTATAVRLGPGRFAVGARSSSIGGSRIYPYQWDGTSAVPQGILVDPAAESDTRFGSALAAVGSQQLIVGSYAKGALPAYQDYGCAYLYGWNGTSWMLQATVSNPVVLADSEDFGRAVTGLGTNRFAVGAPGAGPNRSGLVFLYTWNGAAAEPWMVITNPAPASLGDDFGCALHALGTNRLAIGARYDDSANLFSGSVYVYELGVDRATLVAEIAHPLPETLAFFGSSLDALDENRLLVGVPGADVPGMDAGEAWVLSLDAPLSASFEPLQTQALIQVTAWNDGLSESPEAVLLDLAAVAGGEAGVPSQHFLTIGDSGTTSFALQVSSAYGAPTPPVGWHALLGGSAITNRAGEPVTAGSTQYACTGWSMTGHEPAAGFANQLAMVPTNQAALTWLWTTNVYLSLATNGPGSLLGPPGSGWYAQGSVLSITAAPNAGARFAGWSGDLPVAMTNGAALAVTMDVARALSARFVQPGYLTLSAAALSVPEQTPQLLLTVVRTNGTEGAVAVTYATADGSATSPSDFTASTGTVLLAGGQAGATFVLGVSDDFSPEPDEDFTVTLGSPFGGAFLGGITQATITVTNDDVPGALALEAAEYPVTEAVSSVVLRVVRTQGASAPVTVDYYTTNVTAAAGADYVAQAGTLSLGPGEFSRSFSVPLTSDGSPEPTETFLVNLRNPGGGVTLGATTSAVVRIQDDDDSVQFEAAKLTVNEGAPVVQFKLLRTGNATGSVSVSVGLQPFTAFQGSDFVGGNGTLFFAPGQLEATNTITVLDDAALDSSGVESSLFYLASATGGATCGPGSNLWLEVVDNESVIHSNGFNGGLPSGWSVSSANVAAWRFDNPAGRANGTGGSGGFASADSAYYAAYLMDTALETPAFDLRGYSAVQVLLKSYFNRHPGTYVYQQCGFSCGNSICYYNCSYYNDAYTELGALEARIGSGPWVSILASQYGLAGPVDVSTQVAGQNNVKFRLRYYNAKNQYWWQVDDFMLAAGQTTPSGPASIGFPAAAIAVKESDPYWDAALYSIRQGAISPNLGAQIVFAGGTAQPGLDFAFNGDAHMGGGEVQHTLHIANLNDSLAEGNETFILQLTNPQYGAVLGVFTQTVVTIIDDDLPMANLAVSLPGAPSRAVKGVPQSLTAQVANYGPLPATNVVLTYSYPADRLSVTSAGSSKGSVAQEPGGVKFLIGRLMVNEATICNLTRLPLAGGEVVSRFAVASDNYDASPANNQTDLTTYVESPGLFGFAEGSVQVDENQGWASATVIRSQGGEGAAAVGFRTVDARAVSNSDYVATTGRLQFADGVVAQTISIPITDDLAFEGTEHFLVQLEDPSPGAGLAPAATLAVNIRDDEAFTSFADQGFGGSGFRPLRTASAPAGWTVFDWAASGAVWRFDDPAGRSNRTGGDGGFAIADSLLFGATNMNTQLVSPAYNMSTTLTVSLEFKTDFHQGANGLGQVYVNTGGQTGTWSLVWETRGADLPGPRAVNLDLTAFAAAHTDVVVAFNYVNATNGGWWQVDDVRIFGEPDSDEDGMPDWWEARHFGTATGALAAVDSDQDGLDDLDEFLADTNPTNSFSLPGLFIVATNGAPALEFETSPLRLYDLQGTADLGTGIWEDISSGLLGNGGIQSAPGDAPAERRSYRLRVRR